MKNEILICHNAITPADVPALNTLLHILSTRAQDRSWVHWDNVTRYSHLFCAINDESSEIIGMLSLIPHYQPIGHFGMIEDVVVHNDFQRRGIGTALLDVAMEKARALKMESVRLTSNPQRRSARAWYERHGFSLIGETGKFIYFL